VCMLTMMTHRWPCGRNQQPAAVLVAAACQRQRPLAGLKQLQHKQRWACLPETVCNPCACRSSLRMRSTERERMPLQDPFAMLSARREVTAGPDGSMACNGSGGGSSEAPLPGKRPALDDEEPEDVADEDIARLVRERMQQHRLKRARRRRVRA